jgi:CubicO group peptidase (beta-lactamase class C family)
MRSPLPLTVGTLLLSSLAASARGEEPSAPAPAGLEAVLSPIRNRHGLPALGGAVFTRDGATALGAVGIRKAGDPTPVTREDRWHLGSCTKSMTATLVARLVERGELGFQDPLGTSFAGLEVHPELRAVTLERLLAHRGGMPSAYPPELWAWCWRAEADGRGQRERMAREMLARPPAQAPGTYLYANSGYDLVGAAIERRKDRAFEGLLRMEVFEPLGLSSAGFGAPGEPGKVVEPWGHAPGKEPKPIEPGPRGDNPLVLSPAGRVHMSLTDWARYLAVHLGPAQDMSPTAGAKPYLRAETLRYLHTPRDGEEYAFGWIVTRRPWAKGPVLTHAGSNTMWYAVAWLAPESGFGVLAATNVGGDGAAKACDEAAAALLRWIRER